VEEVILANLERLAEEGFTDTAVEAAINTIEFSLRENNTGSFPRGLSLMLRAMASWIYDRDPFQPLQWTRDLSHFKVRPAACASAASADPWCLVCRGAAAPLQLLGWVSHAVEWHFYDVTGGIYWQHLAVRTAPAHPVDIDVADEDRWVHIKASACHCPALAAVVWLVGY
jgi:hypothetical protein